MKPLYLASGSPRRRELLTQIGVPFTAIGADIDETPLDHETPSTYVERLARGKAEAGRRALDAGVDGCVLGADTASGTGRTNSRQTRGPGQLHDDALEPVRSRT